VDGILRRFARPICRQTFKMRQGPTNSPRNAQPRSTPPNGTDAARAGIRSLDCGDEMTDPATTVVRRAAKPGAVAPSPETDARVLGEQRRSV
jgi:hypothetical protein